MDGICLKPHKNKFNFIKLVGTTIICETLPTTMKKLLTIISILILLTSCESKKNNSIEKENKIETKVLTTELDRQKEEKTPLDEENKIRVETNNLFLTERSKCSKNINAVTNFNGKKEFWKICKSDNGNRIIQIESYDDASLFKEVYFEQDGELIYAEESIKHMPINHYTMGIWNCQFYTDNGKLVTIMSLGHGKTENDKWDPEIIFEMHKKRIIELNKIKKE